MEDADETVAEARSADVPVARRAAGRKTPWCGKISNTCMRRAVRSLPWPNMTGSGSAEHGSAITVPRPWKPGMGAINRRGLTSPMTPSE